MARAIYPSEGTTTEYKTRFYENPAISEANKETVKDFITKQESLGVGQRRIRKTLSNLTTILTRINPGFELTSASEDNIIELSNRIKESEYAARTKEDFHIVIRRYFKVVEGRNSRYPEKLDYFKTPKRAKTSKGPDDLISRDALKALMSKGCLNSMDLALAIVLYEGGLRCGELLNMDVKDIRVKDDGLDLHVNDKPGNKTGPRDICLIESYGPVKAWVEGHPYKNKLDSSLWVMTKKTKGGERVHTPLNAFALRAKLKRMAKRAGLDPKKIHSHAFRHTCATEKAVLGFSESQLNAWMGWTPSSRMASTYIHMTGKGVKEAYRRALGLPTEEQKAVKQCPKCGYENSYLTQECGRCRTSLDPKKRLEQESRKDITLRLLDALSKKDVTLPKHIEDITIRFSDDEEISGLLQRLRIITKS